MQNIDPEIDSLKSRFKFSRGILAGLIFLAATGTVTGLIPNPFYVRMVQVTLLDYLFLSTTSFLAAVYFGKRQCTVTEGRLAKLSGLTGFLAFSCPVCNAVLVAFFSSSVIMSYVEPLRPLLGVTSTLLLGLLIYRDFS